MKIHEDDISKRLFMDALNKALERCGGNVCDLSKHLGTLRSRPYAWLTGRMPPYATMQKMYFKILKVCDDGK